MRGISFRDLAPRLLILGAAVGWCSVVDHAPGYAEESPLYVEVAWQIDGGSKAIQAQQFTDLFVFLRQMRAEHAYVETMTLENPTGLEAIALMAKNDLLVGNALPRPIDRFLCLINDVCKTIRSDPNWVIHEGDPIKVPKLDILRYVVPRPSSVTLADAAEVVVEKRNGCTSYDASCKNVVEALNPPPPTSAAQLNAPTILPIEVALVTVRIDISQATDAAKKEIEQHSAGPQAGAEESATAAPTPLPQPSQPQLDLLQALDDVQSAIDWKDAPRSSFIPTFGIDVVDQAFDPAHCAFAKHQITLNVVEIEQTTNSAAASNNATAVATNTAAAKTELSAADCGKVTDESHLVAVEPDHGTHVVGIIAGLLAEPNTFEVPIKISGVKIKPNLLSTKKFNALLAEALFKQIKDNQTKVVNLSAGYRPEVDETDPFQTLIKDTAKAALYVVAAGNEGIHMEVGNCPIQPACGPYADNRISVVAMKKGSVPAILPGKSNFGGQFDLGAPGDGISSTRPGGEMIALSGSSQATAVVSAAALRLALAAPELLPKRIRDRLIYTSDINAETVEKLFGGRVNVTHALDFSEDTLTLADKDGNKTDYRGHLLLSDETNRVRSTAKGDPNVFTYMEPGSTEWNALTPRLVKRLQRIGDKSWVLFYAKGKAQRLTRTLASKFPETEGWFVTDAGDDVKFVWSNVVNYQSCIREEADQCYQP